ncbi:MAG TPA: hypothetical protein VFM93_10920 [Candidatus Limnocylindria bacterium]|nr:hypothetical protein [Candidatus Limnocylindria bacterium]
MDLFRAFRTAAWLALFGAIYQELRKPPEERTWHGKVLGIVPYDLRMPSIEKVRKAYWDPSRDEIFSEDVVGVGWAVNIPVAIRRLNAGATQYASASRRRGPAARLPEDGARR